jgi:ribokinase
VVGSVNNDLTFVVDRLPQPGATVLASSLVYAPGGKGANQAIAAARSGAQVEFVGAVGDDAAAAALISHLRANGVGTKAVSSIAGPSGTAVVIVDAAAENVIVVAPEANSHLKLGSENARLRLTESDVVLMQLEIPLPTVLDAARLARQSGATVMLNASPITGEISPLAEMAEFLDVVVVNEEEAVDWRWQVPHLVITRGSRGASYIGTERSFDVPALDVDAVDTTGAGDVFAGVLAASWGDGPDRAVRRACTASAFPTCFRVAAARSSATNCECTHPGQTLNSPWPVRHSVCFVAPTRA